MSGSQFSPIYVGKPALPHRIEPRESASREGREGREGGREGSFGSALTFNIYITQYGGVVL